jgi:hypothetical protein
MRAVVLTIAGAVVALVVGIFVWSTTGGGSDEPDATYRHVGEEYPIDCERRDMSMRQMLGEPGLLTPDVVIDPWAEECGWTGDGPWYGTEVRD